MPAKGIIMFENTNPFVTENKPHFINQSENLAMALHYAEVMGWPVFPVNHPVGNGCSCHKECKSIGKHPMIGDWPNTATIDKTQIINWWTQNPDANIGIPTGANTFYVLDIDVADGKQGLESLEKLELQYGKLPETLSATTGSGGKHYCFAKPGNTRLTNKTNIMPGLDFRGDGGYIVVEPSLHSSGGSYKWDNLVGVEFYEYPDEMPAWLVEVVSKEKVNSSQPNIQNLSTAPIKNGARNDTLFRLGCSFRENGNDESFIFSVLNGINLGLEEPLDDSEVQKIVSNICNRYPINEKNQAPVFDLAGYLNEKYQIESNRDPNDLLGYRLGKFSNIQNKLNGIQSGFYIVAAETNVGKTAFLTNLFIDLVENNDVTGIYFSMDDHKKDIINKIISARTNISITDMQKRQSNINAQQRIKDGYKWMIDLNRRDKLQIYDQSNLFHLNQVKILADQLSGKKFFFAIDGIFNIDVGNFDYKREENIQRANELKRIADKYDIPVIGSAEVRKNVGKSSGTRNLSLDDIMETAKFAYNANLVWLLSEGQAVIENQVPLVLKYAKNKLTGYKQSQNLIYETEFGKVSEQLLPSIMRCI
jgi:hypothetical protein